MIVGIVGSEAAKFTSYGEGAARGVISEILNKPGVTEVVSGACHLGGIDIWAVEAAKSRRLLYKEFPPLHHSWEYYKSRNLAIVERSDKIHCITVDFLPEDFKGMRFELCYHCKTKDHIKSGGCWTMKQAIIRGKPGYLHIVKNVGTYE